MTDRRLIDRVVRVGAVACATLALGACASGTNMFLAGNDGGPSGGFEEESFEDYPSDESPLDTPAGAETRSPVLATSGNSLLPLPAAFAQQAPNALAPTGAGGLSVQSPLVNATLGGAPTGLAASAALAGVPVAAVNQGTVSVLGAPVVSAGPGSVAALGVPLAGAGSVTNALANPTATVANTANTLVSNVPATVMAVTAPATQATGSPLTSMVPGTAPISTVVTLLTRPGL